MSYKKVPYEVGQDTSVLQCNRLSDKTVAVRPNLPGNIIVIHGVNDVGVGFEKVEQGLCAGLKERLGWEYVPANYRMPGAKDKEILLDDPDAVYFKRQIDENTDSPVIPFYWGYRELDGKVKIKNGQHIDRDGNRIDKDLSKGGGPFGNATSTLPDMWNRGVGAPADPLGDPIRPVLPGPERMYMILAARRLAALISMIRDYDPNEVVSIVAHSQGTMLSLLAQAFLLDQGLRPVDTLVMVDTPYSLVDKVPLAMDIVELFASGDNPEMHGQYGKISDRQTFDARLQTLVNIVKGVTHGKHPVPAFATLDNQAVHHGMVSCKWKATADRDNRGKVYLYFCPEDMTVAIDAIQGIGWQGVPDFWSGCALSKTEVAKSERVSMWSNDVIVTWKQNYVWREPMTELGAGFFQRVFTNKKRLDLKKNTVGPVLVGQGSHDFALRIEGEDDHSHVSKSERGYRTHSPEVAWPVHTKTLGFIPRTDKGMRDGIRTINGESLPEPVIPDLRGTGQIDSKDYPKTSEQAKRPASAQGPCEEVDQIDAAIAMTSSHGLHNVEQVIDDPRLSVAHKRLPTFGGLGSGENKQLEEAINKDKPPADRCKVIGFSMNKGGKILLNRFETENEARLRWQHEISPKSFHSAIFASVANHRNVTAYDVAIGGGKAVTDTLFYKYLCAVADWRLSQNKNMKRPGIKQWADFVKQFSVYFDTEPVWRQEIIEGNAKYYSSGSLPKCVPTLSGLPSLVVCETLNGLRTNSVPAPGEKRVASIDKIDGADQQAST